MDTADVKQNADEVTDLTKSEIPENGNEVGSDDCILITESETITTTATTESAVAATNKNSTISVDGKKPIMGTAAARKRKGGANATNPENDNAVKKRGSRKTKKRRIEEGAPRPPLTGYVRFLNERREKLKPDHPDKNHIEMTKIIADEWSRLSEQDKTPYLKVAEAERAVYNNAMVEFYKQKRLAGQENKNPVTANKTNTNGSTKAISNGSSAKYAQMNGNSSDPATTNKITPSAPSAKFVSEHRPNDGRLLQSYYPDGCIPIFTDDFLDHNKTIDLELRALRKSNIDYEQQNSVLEKHIENMKTGVEKIENENKELAEKNRLMQKYLDKLKAKLVQAFATLPLPGEPNGATFDNIDKYMTDLHGMVSSSNSHNINKAKDIIRKLDLHITL